LSGNLTLQASPDAAALPKQDGQAEQPAQSKREPFGVYKRQQARISRRRLYPVTAFYTGYSILLFAFVFRSSHPWIGVSCFLLGIALWTLIEYLSHRYILHGRFPPANDPIRKFFHRRLDPLHWEHHERPFDGLHINGVLSDLMPLFAVCAPISFLAPVYTLPILMAGTIQGYVIEEWVHHCVHYYHFHNPVFRYIQRYHLYHHSPKGEREGYGISSPIWDFVFDTTYPQKIREALSFRRWRGAR